MTGHRPLAVDGGGRRAVPSSSVPAVDRTTPGGDSPTSRSQTLRGGEAFRLDELEGPAVVNLWATWCAPCKRELPEFEAVHRSLAGEVTFVGVNIGDDGDDAADYLDDLGITYDQYLDFDSELTAALKTATLPMTLIIDADEQIALRHIGPLDQDELIEAIEQQEHADRPEQADDRDDGRATTPTVNAPTVTARSSQYGAVSGQQCLAQAGAAVERPCGQLEPGDRGRRVPTRCRPEHPRRDRERHGEHRQQPPDRTRAGDAGRDA